jgi:hypothetical protein
MIEVKPPRDYSAHKGMISIFLAGSIEMGKAVDWQAQVAAAFSHAEVLILNPRRDNWDAGWEQKIGNAPFREQVEWELDALDAADLILFYFAPETKAPVTLLELGLHAAAAPEKLLVCCPEGFWRKGNVDIVCTRHGVRQAATLREMIAATERLIGQRAISS